MRLGRFSLFESRGVKSRALMLCSAIIEVAIFLSHAVWLFRTRKIRRRAKEAGLEWIDFPEAQTWQEDRYRLSWSWNKSNASTLNEATGGDVVGDGHASIENSPNVPERSGDIEKCT